VAALRFSSPFPLFVRTTVSLLAAAVALTACDQSTDAPEPPTETQPATGTESLTPDFSGRSAAGAYLASRQAFVKRDLPNALALMRQTLALNPGHTELRRHTMLMAVTAGQLDVADAEAAQLSRQLPNDYAVALIQAVSAVRRDDFEAARLALTRLPTAELSGLWQPLLLAWIDAGTGNLEGAASRLAEDRQPPQLRPLAILHQAFLAQMRGHRADAARLYSALSESLEQPPLRLVLFAGRVLTENQDADAAARLLKAYGDQARMPTLIARLEAALQQDAPQGLGTLRSARDGLAEALLDVGDLLNQEQSRELAIVHVRLALSLRPDLAYGWLMLGQMLADEGFLDAARAACKQVPDDSPLGWQAQLQQADVLLLEKQTPDAIRLLESMRQQAPHDLHVLMRIGELLRGAERYKDAIPVYDQAVALAGQTPEPHHWALYYARGIALERTKQWRRAEADLRTALRLMPEQPQVLNYLAYSWVEQGVRLQEALEMLRRAAAQAPDDSYIIDSLGWTYYKLGDYDAAVMHLEHAVALRPFDAQMLDHLGDAYWQQGRRREARFRWKQALDFDPPAADAERIRLKLTQGL
jgi:tetratricopeptide (TPR) repeat protein